LICPNSVNRPLAKNECEQENPSDIENIVYELIVVSDKHYKIVNEDLEDIKSNAFNIQT